MSLETGLVALAFAAAFLIGGRIHPLQRVVRDHRTIVSFGAGMSAAYVFVHVMPELQGARVAFAESASIPLRYEGMAVYFLALIGFLMFYGIDHLRKRLAASTEAASLGAEFKLHVGGFAIYVALMSYLLVRNLEETAVSATLYGIAIVFHFLAVDHEFRQQHGAAYERVGRFVLAGMAIAGWGMGVLFELPDAALALLLAFVSGSVIMNVSIMELPSEKEGRFAAFVSGGVIYGLVLLPLS